MRAFGVAIILLLTTAPTPLPAQDGGYWKDPFHLPRMQLLCWKLLEDENLS